MAQWMHACVLQKVCQDLCTMERRSKILVCFSQGMMALAGVAYASLVVSSFSRAQKKVLEMGFEDGINTSTMISGNAVKM